MAVNVTDHNAFLLLFPPLNIAIAVFYRSWKPL
jgi:hypothetical protein